MLYDYGAIAPLVVGSCFVLGYGAFRCLLGLLAAIVRAEFNSAESLRAHQK